jgi:hypothetical protein
MQARRSTHVGGMNRERGAEDEIALDVFVVVNVKKKVSSVIFLREFEREFHNIYTVYIYSKTCFRIIRNI